MGLPVYDLKRKLQNTEKTKSQRDNHGIKYNLYIKEIKETVKKVT